MPNTIWPGISSFFKETFWFFRSALTPVSLFANQVSEVISSDGPQTVNLGITVASMLKAKRAYLCGVDLGAASPDNPRVSGAHGDTVRNLTIPARGNRGRTVFTDPLLQIVKNAVQGAVNSTPTKFFNVSNGLYIEGAAPTDLKDVVFDDSVNENEKSSLLDSFRSQMPAYTSERFEDQWFSVDLRQVTFNFFGALKSLFFSCAGEWNAKKLKEFYLFLDYSKANLREQTMQRLCRGDVMRWVMTIDNAYKRIGIPR